MSEEGITPGDGERDPVSVAKLLARHQGRQGGAQSGAPVRERVPRHKDPALLPTPSPASTSDTGQMFVTELLRREGQEEPAPTPPGPAQPPEIYRLFALLCGLTLLIGAIAASTAALSGPRAQRTVPSSAAASFAGAQALRPDLIGASVRLPPLAAPPPPRAGVDGQDRAAGRPSTVAGPQPEPEVGRTEPGRADRQPPRAAPAPSPTPSGDMVDPRLGSTLGTVQSFFQSVATAPRQAFGLLGPHMQGPGWPEFRDAWADVERVTVDEIHPDGPDAVLVTARLELKDGTVLHTVQRVLVIPGAQPQITDARLLAASRS